MNNSSMQKEHVQKHKVKDFAWNKMKNQGKLENLVAKTLTEYPKKTEIYPERERENIQWGTCYLYSK